MKTVSRKPVVAVLAGGIGQERNISIQSGKYVAEALKKAGLKIIAADIRPDNLDILDDSSIDVFFIALHGKFGEDGQLQQILEDKSLIYTGSGPKPSKLCFDKMASKSAFTRAGINTPAAIEFDPNDDIQQLEKKLKRLTDKYVVKPIKQGSSVGISIENDPHEAIAAAKKCYNEFGDCMIEKFISGREITVGILCGKALPIIEIRTKTDFYDYHAKYIDKQTEFLCDTVTDMKLTKKIQETAVDCFNTLGCRGFARVDFILESEKNIQALEVNTIPGFTNHSLLPRAAARAGISMSNLCTKIVETALKKTQNLKLKNSN